MSKDMRLLSGLSLLFFVAYRADATEGCSLDFAANAYKDGQYKAAIPCWKQLALEGSLLAQVSLGYSYVNGKGVVKNKEKAYEWFYLAEMLNKDVPWEPVRSGADLHELEWVTYSRRMLEELSHEIDQEEISKIEARVRRLVGDMRK
jgi:TPR repeat protein